MTTVKFNVSGMDPDKLKKISKDIEDSIRDAFLNGFPHNAPVINSQSYRMSTQGIWNNPRATPAFMRDLRSDLLNAEDIEWGDAQAINRLVEIYFADTYPDFDPEIIHGQDKDYYLPALKILNFDGRDYYSPQQKSKWVDGELTAECQKYVDFQGSPHFRRGDYLYPASSDKHDWKSCDCGIYGSVNLEEVASFLDSWGLWKDPFVPQEDEDSLSKKLVIIEPSPGADTILCRKGWRAEQAFISEIVGETISLSDASNLLSIVWHRRIDLRELKHENR